MPRDEHFHQLPLELHGGEAGEGVGVGTAEDGRGEDGREVLAVHHVLLAPLADPVRR